MRTHLLQKTALVAVIGWLCGSSAFAQGFIKKDQDLPNASGFYMARQQWQIIQEAPIINGQVNPAAQQGNPNAIPGVPPRGLPRAGFQNWSQEVAPPGLSSSLPKVNNGVPPKLPPQKALPAGARGGKAGKLPSGGAGAGGGRNNPSMGSPQSVQAYSPYKGYNPTPDVGATNSGMSGANSRSNVQGSVLHWARSHPH